MRGESDYYTHGKSSSILRGLSFVTMLVMIALVASIVAVSLSGVALGKDSGSSSSEPILNTTYVFSSPLTTYSRQLSKRNCFTAKDK
jgi:hypothetical protein